MSTVDFDTALEIVFQRIGIDVECSRDEDFVAFRESVRVIDDESRDAFLDRHGSALCFDFGHLHGFEIEFVPVFNLLDTISDGISPRGETFDFRVETGFETLEGFDQADTVFDFELDSTVEGFESVLEALLVEFWIEDVIEEVDVGLSEIVESVGIGQVKHSFQMQKMTARMTVEM